MTSPFPGMDPFLEGYLWPDVHQEMASAIRQLIAPVIAPQYVARINLYTVDDTSPEEDVGIMYPDVDILKRRDTMEEKETSSNGGVAVLTPASVSVQLKPLEVRIPVIEIRDRGKNTLITAIEILSPVNKRRPGLKPYRKKRQELRKAGVHFLEIDLIRRGERPFFHPRIPACHYLISLIRGGKKRGDFWAFNVQEKLPVIPMPLKKPDPDVPLDLGKALDLVYERSLYHLSIDYAETPPVPAFSEKDAAWLDKLLHQ